MKSPAQSWRTALWVAWLGGVVWITAGLFRELVEAFRNPGPEFYRVLLWGLPLFVPTAGFYLWFRRAGMWRHEPAIVAGICGGAFFFYRFQATLLLVCLFIACYASGAWLLDRLGLGGGTAESQIPVATALGLSMFGPILFALGMLHLYYAWIFVVVLAAPCVLFYRRWIGLIASFREMQRRWGNCVELRSPFVGLSVIYIAMAAVAACVVMLAPSLSFDALHMHLREAFFYVNRHGLMPVPGLTYSYYPGAYEALLSMTAALGGQPAAQAPSAMFIGLAGLLAFRLAREAGASGGAALVGVAAVFTAPAFHVTASIAKNDLMLVVFELAALECFLCWRRDGNFRWILAGAFLVAGAFDVKHVALFGAIPLLAMYLFAVWSQPARLLALGQLVLVLALFGTYWHARTFLLTGNPVYPESTARAALIWGVPGTPSNWFAGPLERYARVIWQVHFQGRFAFEGPLRAPLGVFLVVFLPAWILFRKKEGNRTGAILFLFAGLYLAYWIHTSPVLRYSLPATVLVLALTGSRAAEWFERPGLVLHGSLLLAMGYALTFAMLGTAIMGLNGPQLRWLAKRTDDRGYLREALATYAASEFLAGAASQDDQVLGLDYFANIYSPASIRITGFLTADGKPSPEFLRRLEQAGYQWIVAPRTAVPELNPDERGHGLTQVFADNHYAVFRAER